jgi:EmrB/QacA subfamily drug resistance transporter
MKASHKWSVAAVVMIGPVLAFMDNTIVSVILSQLQNTFHTDFDTITWVASAYFLAQAAVIPIVGYLSDRFGSKRAFLAAIVLFTSSSLLCSLSPTKEALIVFRVLQGIGGGALLPLAYAINYRIFPPNERSKVTAVLSIPLVMAPTFGPTVGGYLSTSFNWNAVFLINVPIGMVALLLSFLILPGRTSDGSGMPQTKGARKSIDVVGLLLSVAGVTALVYGITLAGSKGWGAPTVLTGILIGAMVLIVFIVVELRVSDPVLDLRLFKNYTFTISNFLIWFTLAVFNGGLFLLPFFLENVQGGTALIAGQALIGQGLGLAVGSSTSGMFYNRLGPRRLAVFGLLCLTIGTYGLTQIEVNTTVQALQVWLILRGLGVGFVYQSTQTLALSVVSNKGMARASSLVNVARQMASATAVAVLTTYLTAQTITHATDISHALQTGLQTHNLTGVAATCAQTTAQAAVNACVLRSAMATGIADTFRVILILTAVSVLPALLLGRDPAIAALKQAQQAKETGREPRTEQAQDTVPTAPQEVYQEISATNLHSEGQLSKREPLSRSRIARVRLVPLGPAP